MRRKNAHGALGDLEVIHSLLHIRADVLGGEHNALALTGRSGGEHDRSKRIVIDFVIIVGVIACAVLFITCKTDALERDRALGDLQKGSIA